MTHINEDLKLESYFYDLPQRLIASQQLGKRDESKLLVYKKKSNQIIHSIFKNLPSFLNKEQTLVLNNSKVFPCRLLVSKTSGAKAEVFLLERTADVNKQYNVLIRSSKKKKVGDEYCVGELLRIKIEKINDDQTFNVSMNRELTDELLEQIGKIPIPPYIRDGESNSLDTQNYQTIFAKFKGSVAAPTAGLHFTDSVFSDLKKQGINHAFITLHVGPGTFLPVKTSNIEDHQMHFEKYFVEQDSLNMIKMSSDIIAVGTTSLRVLESIDLETIKPNQTYQTNIFLHPGKSINKVKGLITNFHLPESSLIMLVSCLIGRSKVMELYNEAIQNEYRFYSYGDSMLILLEE